MTDLDQALLGLLKTSNAGKATRAIAYTLMGTDAQKLKMCRFLLDNEDATNEEIDAETRRLCRLSMTPSAAER